MGEEVASLIRSLDKPKKLITGYGFVNIFKRMGREAKPPPPHPHPDSDAYAI